MTPFLIVQKWLDVRFPRYLLGLTVGCLLGGITFLAGCATPPRPIIIVVPDSDEADHDGMGRRRPSDSMFMYTRRQIEEMVADSPRPRRWGRPTAEQLAYEALTEDARPDTDEVPDDLRDALEEMTHKAESLEEELLVNQATIADLQRRSAEWQELADRRAEELAEYEKQLVAVEQKLTEQKTDVEERVVILQAELDSANLELQSVLDQLQAAEHEKSELTATLGEARNVRSALEQQIADSEAEHAAQLIAWETERAELESAHASTVASLEQSLEEAVDAAKNQHTDLIAALADAEANRVHLRDQLVTMESNHAAQLRDMESKLSELESAHEREVAALQQALAENDYGEQLAEAESLALALAEQVSALESAHAEQVAELEEQRLLMKSLHEDEKAELQQSLKQAAEKAEQRDAELAALADAEADRVQLQENLATMESNHAAQLRDFESKLSELESAHEKEVAALQQALAENDFGEQLAEKESRALALAEQVSALESAHAEQLAELEEQRLLMESSHADEMSELQKSFEQAEEKAAQRDAELAAEIAEAEKVQAVLVQQLRSAHDLREKRLAAWATQRTELESAYSMEVGRLQQKLDEAIELHAAQQAEQEMLIAEIESKREQLASARAELQKIESQLELDQDKEVAALESQLAEVQSEFEALSGALATLEEERDALAEESQRRVEQYDSAVAEMDRLRKEAAAQEEEHAESLRELQEVERIRAAAHEVAQAERASLEIQTLIEQHDERSADLRAQLESANQHMEMLTEQRSELESKRILHLARIEELEEELAKKELSQTEAIQQAILEREQLWESQMSARVAELEVQISSISEQAEALQAERDDLAASLHTEQAEWESRLAELEAMRDKLMAERDMIAAQREEDQDAFEQQLTQLRGQHHDALSELQADLEVAQQESADMELTQQVEDSSAIDIAYTDDDRAGDAVSIVDSADAEETVAADVEAVKDADDDGRRRGGLLGWFRSRDAADEAVVAEEQDDIADPASALVQAGAEINVQVFREPDFSGTFVVNHDGLIRHPLMGSLRLAGMTLSEVEEKIVTELAARYLVDPRVVVTMQQTQQARIVLLGEIKRPGVYEYPVGETLTLLEAIAKAGGFTELASVDRVRLVRSDNGESRSSRIRVSRVLSGREQDVELQPNDVITVPEVRF